MLKYTKEFITKLHTELRLSSDDFIKIYLHDDKQLYLDIFVEGVVKPFMFDDDDLLMPIDELITSIGKVYFNKRNEQRERQLSKTKKHMLGN